MLSVYGRFALNPRAENLLLEDKVDDIFAKFKYYPIMDITSF